MSTDDLRDQILRIEADIENHAETLDGCRKAMLLSKVAIAAGAICLSVYLLGAVWLNAVAVIGAMAAVIGGVVVFGSNLTTSNQTTTAIKALESTSRNDRHDQSSNYRDERGPLKPFATSWLCPLYPRKRTCAVQCHVRFVPIADIARDAIRLSPTSRRS